jgi:hypothetical protein
VYIESSTIGGAWDNAIDFVAVQYGHITGSKIHTGGWCLYVKVGRARTHARRFAALLHGDHAPSHALQTLSCVCLWGSCVCAGACLCSKSARVEGWTVPALVPVRGYTHTRPLSSMPTMPRGFATCACSQAIFDAIVLPQMPASRQFSMGFFFSRCKPGRCGPVLCCRGVQHITSSRETRSMTAASRALLPGRAPASSTWSAPGLDTRHMTLK